MSRPPRSTPRPLALAGPGLPYSDSPRSSLDRRSLLRAALAAAALPACSGAPSPAPRPPAPSVSLHLDPLTDLAPAGGLEVLAVFRWREVLRALDGPARRLLASDGLDALRTQLGVDPRQIEELVVASYGSSTLYLLRVPHDPREVERLFTRRLTGEITRGNEGPGVVRLAGTIGTTPRALATFLPDVLALEVGPPGPLRASIAFAQGRLKKARPALAAPPLDVLAPRLPDAPWKLYFPAPPASVGGAHGLLDRAAAAAFALTPDDTRLRLHAALLGAWGDPPDEARRRLDLTVRDVTSSPLGHLTGLDEPLDAYRSGGDSELLTLDGAVDLSRLAQGLHDITKASMAELFPPPKAR